jgi:hypothetical protein
LEAVHAAVHQLAESYSERATTIQAELSKLKNAAEREGLSGEGRADQILSNINEISKLISLLESKLKQMKAFVDSRLADALALARNAKGTADSEAAIKAQAAEANAGLRKNG